MDSDNKRYTMEIVGTRNPVKIKMPVIPGMTTKAVQRYLTIDACTFTVDTLLPAPIYPLGGNSDTVKVLFNNGFGVYNEEGKMTKVLELMDATTEHCPSDRARKKWHLVGSPDAFVWSEGHDLEIGFTNINDLPLNFEELQTNYIITLEVEIS